MTIWERVVTALTSLGVPLAESVMMMGGTSPLPDEYITFFEVSSAAMQHADNVEKHRDNTIQISYYNRAGLVSMPDIVTAMTAAGFMSGPRRELPYNQDTRHFGYALDFVYVE